MPMAADSLAACNNEIVSDLHVVNLTRELDRKAVLNLLKSQIHVLPLSFHSYSTEMPKQ